MKFRTGFGYDVHAFSENRKLFLGGVQIPSEKGLLGHSDADVLLHAVCDALLGALALGDIGIHFPDTDPAYKNIDSKILLKNVNKLIEEKGYKIDNASLQYIAKDLVTVDGKNAEDVIKCIEAIEEYDDVQNVFTNADFSDVE